MCFGEKKASEKARRQRLVEDPDLKPKLFDLIARRVLLQFLDGVPQKERHERGEVRPATTISWHINSV
jgi:hypothetical protein